MQFWAKPYLSHEVAVLGGANGRVTHKFKFTAKPKEHASDYSKICPDDLTKRFNLPDSDSKQASYLKELSAVINAAPK